MEVEAVYAIVVFNVREGEGENGTYLWNNFFLLRFSGSNRFQNWTEQAEPVLNSSVPVPVQFLLKTIGSVLSSQKMGQEPDWTELRQLGISRGWALPRGSRVGVRAGTGTGQGPDTRALSNGLIFSQNG